VVIGPIADYLIWLEYEHYLRGTTVTASERETWHGARLSWVVELIQVMQIDTMELIAQIRAIFDYNFSDLLLEDSEKERIITHLLASIKEVKICVAKQILKPTIVLCLVR
jgi:hypothetical protein